MAENQERNIVTYCVKDGKLFPLQSSNYVYFMRRKPRRNYSDVSNIIDLFSSLFLFLFEVVYSYWYTIFLFPWHITKCVRYCQVFHDLSERCMWQHSTVLHNIRTIRVNMICVTPSKRESSFLTRIFSFISVYGQVTQTRKDYYCNEIWDHIFSVFWFQNQC